MLRFVAVRRAFTVSFNARQNAVTSAESLTALQNKFKNTEVAMASQVEHLSPDDPIVKRLFHPYIPADFEPQVDAKGTAKPPRVSQVDLQWLHQHAYMFGLHPVHDLSLPPLVRERESPVDQRMAARLARAEADRQHKEQLKRDREEKARKRQLAQGKITQQQFDEQVQAQAEREASGEGRKMLPLAVQPRAAREVHQQQKLETIGGLMAGMDAKIAAWRDKKRNQRHQHQAQKHAF